MMNKKTLLVGSGLVSLALIVWNYIGNYRLCDILASQGSLGGCPFLLTKIGLNLVPVIPLFLFALITYKMRDEVYRPWVRFSLVAVPLIMVGILFAPEYSSNMFYAVTKGSLTFVTFWAYTLISLLIILVQSVRVYWLKK